VIGRGYSLPLGKCVATSRTVCLVWGLWRYCGDSNRVPIRWLRASASVTEERLGVSLKLRK